MDTWATPYCIKPYIGELVSTQYALFIDPTCWIQDEEQIVNLLKHTHKYTAGFCGQLPCAEYPFYEDAPLSTRVALNDKLCTNMNIFGIDKKSIFYQQWQKRYTKAEFGLDQLYASTTLHDLDIPLLPSETCYHCELLGYPMIDHHQVLYDPTTRQILGSVCLEGLEDTSPKYLGVLRKKQVGPGVRTKLQMISYQFRRLASTYWSLLNTEETSVTSISFKPHT